MCGKSGKRELRIKGRPRPHIIGHRVFNVKKFSKIKKNVKGFREIYTLSCLQKKNNPERWHTDYNKWNLCSDIEYICNWNCSEKTFSKMHYSLELNLAGHHHWRRVHSITKRKARAHAERVIWKIICEIKCCCK